jgi:hypothetical protein
MNTTTRTPNDQSGSSADEQLGLQEQIERRAYAFWLTGGCRHGNDVSDWLQAEQDVLERRAATEKA